MTTVCDRCGRPMSHQGWTNYETWVVNSMLTNDQAAAAYWGSRARQAGEDARGLGADGGSPEIAVDTMEQALRDEVGEPLYRGLSVLNEVAQGLLDNAVHEVNWREIARAFVEGAT